MKKNYEEQIAYLDLIFEYQAEIADMYGLFLTSTPPPPVDPEFYTLAQFVIDFSPQHMIKEWREEWYQSGKILH